MPRQPRVDHPGAWHHVMNRGARRDPIFTDDAHCTLFLDTIGEACRRSGLEVHAYALMPNHFHMLVRSPEGTMAPAMRYLLGRYTRRLNRLHGWDGPVFRGRYHSQLVTRDEHLKWLIAYIHLNPVRAHLVQRPDEECWTSHRAHLGLEGAMPWLHTDAVRGWFGGTDRLAKWVRGVQLGREPFPEEMDLDNGWILAGSEAPPVPASGGRRGRGTPPDAAAQADMLLERVCTITGASREQVTAAVRGRSANPFRRFAILAMTRAGVPHREIARVLDCTTSTVASLRHRFTRGEGLDPSFAAWTDAWEASFASQAVSAT